jgi:hypothetical protein
MDIRTLKMIDGENPFIILAKITMIEGLVNDYLAIAEETNKAVVRFCL